MREANIGLLPITFTGAAIGAALLAWNLGGSSHRAPRPNEKIRFDAPFLVNAISSAHTAKCSADRESALDLATYGALSEPDATLPPCLNIAAAPH
jgi:hypothetical protein